MTGWPQELILSGRLLGCTLPKVHIVRLRIRPKFSPPSEAAMLTSCDMVHIDLQVAFWLKRLWLTDSDGTGGMVPSLQILSRGKTDEV